MPGGAASAAIKAAARAAIALAANARVKPVRLAAPVLAVATLDAAEIRAGRLGSADAVRVITATLLAAYTPGC